MSLTTRMKQTTATPTDPVGGQQPARHPVVSSLLSPAVAKTKGSRDRHYRQKGSGDALSPDDTGYGVGGNISSGRADSHGRGGY